MIVPRSRLFRVLVLASLLLPLMSAATQAETLSGARADTLPPPLPSSFYGRVTVNGQDVPAGTPITVGSWGLVYAQTTSLMYEGSSVYSVNVPGDHPDTPEREGGREGEVLQFTVAGVLANQTATWHSGSNHEHALSGPNEESAFKVWGTSLYLPCVMRAR